MASQQASTGHGLARALSKLGVCSRAEAWRRIETGRVRLNGVLCRDPEQRVRPGRDRIEVDGKPAAAATKVYLMLNKPRGLVTTASDDQGRATVFECLKGVEAPHLLAVGRLDRASEGLLLVTNDTAWAAVITDPASQIVKTYHVQVNAVLDEAKLRQVQAGVDLDGERLSAKRATLLRSGEKNCWVEILLDEGRNRQIRRLMEGLGVEVLRLIRIRVGNLELGSLAKGAYRKLTQGEVADLGKCVDPDGTVPG